MPNLTEHTDSSVMNLWDTEGAASAAEGGGKVWNSFHCLYLRRSKIKKEARILKQ
jgi:hypothetical protein